MIDLALPLGKDGTRLTKTARETPGGASKQASVLHNSGSQTWRRRVGTTAFPVIIMIIVSTASRRRSFPVESALGRVMDCLAFPRSGVGLVWISGPSLESQSNTGSKIANCRR